MVDIHIRTQQLSYSFLMYDTGKIAYYAEVVPKVLCQSHAKSHDKPKQDILQTNTRLNSELFSQTGNIILYRRSDLTINQLSWSGGSL